MPLPSVPEEVSEHRPRKYSSISVNYFLPQLAALRLVCPKAQLPYTDFKPVISCRHYLCPFLLLHAKTSEYVNFSFISWLSICQIIQMTMIVCCFVRLSLLVFEVRFLTQQTLYYQCLWRFKWVKSMSYSQTTCSIFCIIYNC